MKTLFKRKHFQDFERNENPDISDDTISSFLIPKSLLFQLEKSLPTKQRKKGLTYDWKLGLKLLLNRYRGYFAMGNMPFSKKPKILFQEQGLDLKKFCFRPENSDWMELGVLADGMGVSRCWLFSYILELELMGVGEFFSYPEIKKVVTTANVSQPQKISRISRGKLYFRRILHFRT